MSLVAAKCPNCGANLEVDATKDAAVCPFCNTAYITQKAIVNYNNTIVSNTTIHAQTVNIVAGDFDKLMTKAKDSFELDDIDDAYRAVTKALELKPKDIEALLLKSVCFGHLKNTLNPVYSTYNSIFENYTLTKENSDFARHYFDEYLRLVMSIFYKIRENYVQNMNVNGAISTTFQEYEQIINHYYYLIGLYKKLYTFDKKYEPDYVATLKLFCQLLMTCSSKHSYAVFDAYTGLRYKTTTSQHAMKYMRLKKETEDIIIGFDKKYKKIKKLK